jgi:flavin reductase
MKSPKTALADEFRRAMRVFAATASVISCSGSDGSYHGLAVTAVASVSLEPPSLLASVNRAASAFPALCAHGAFCVNVLRSDQEHLCRRFSDPRRREDRFRFGTWQIGHAGLPYVEEAVANLFCETAAWLDFASHRIFVGEVRAVRLSAGCAPLLYVDGGFADLRARAGPP